MEENTFLPLLKTTISEYFPNKYITGLDFRRIIPSLLYEDEDGNPIIPESEVDNFLTNYAGLVNTSKQILKNHYIRSVRINHHRKLLKKIDLQLLDTLESIRTKRAIQNLDNDMADIFTDDSDEEQELRPAKRRKIHNDDEKDGIIVALREENEKLKVKVKKLKAKIEEYKTWSKGEQ